MTISEQLAAFREAAGRPADGGGEPSGRRERWATICVCGHETVMHGVGIGGTFGTYKPDEPMDVDGCRGAVPDASTPKLPKRGGVWIKAATCPCREIRPVAEIDRPGRLMRQKVWTRDSVHPMERGLKALTTRLTNAKTIKDPVAELDRRFRWLPGAQECEVCGSADGSALPCYVDDGRHSEMRCTRHYVFSVADGRR
jgi:hypothetical protein